MENRIGNTIENIEDLKLISIGKAHWNRLGSLCACWGILKVWKLQTDWFCIENERLALLACRKHDLPFNPIEKLEKRCTFWIGTNEIPNRRTRLWSKRRFGGNEKPRIPSRFVWEIEQRAKIATRSRKIKMRSN